jgi:hypothetical protein
MFFGKQRWQLYPQLAEMQWENNSVFGTSPKFEANRKIVTLEGRWSVLGCGHGEFGSHSSGGIALD